MLATFNTRPTNRRTHRPWRSRRTLIAAVATAAALSAPNAAAAEIEGSAPLRPREPIVAVGTGKVIGELPFCFNGAPGPCGWIVEGTHTGTPIRSGTFFAAIDDNNAASSRRCTPASYTGLLYDSNADEIPHVAEGQLCPDRAGGYVFTGRSDIVGGSGRFQEVSGGRGRVVVTMAASGSATITFAGHLDTE